MTSDLLIPLAIVLLPFINWPVAILLLLATRRYPSILSLREGTGMAFVLTIWVSIYLVVTVNAEMGYVWFDFNIARTIVRFGHLFIGLYPIWWLWSYYRNEFN